MVFTCLCVVGFDLSDIERLNHSAPLEMDCSCVFVNWDFFVWSVPFGVSELIVNVSWRFVEQEYLFIYLVVVINMFCVLKFVIIIDLLLFAFVYDFSSGLIACV